MTSVLDNVVWHSLTGRQRHLGTIEGRAGRFDPAVSPFGGVDDLDSEESWSDLATLVGPGGIAVLFGPVIPIPERWTLQHRMPCYQFVATADTPDAPADGLIELGPADVPEILELIKATRPGPFDDRTVEFGTYVGVRKEGRLVAMTGERMKVPGFTEISALCTADDVRGTGLGRTLVSAVVHLIRSRGEEAFLHVLTDNTPAVRLYESMGFTVRCEAEAVIVRAPGEKG
ncbi:MAG: GNAT family N-acetyltransferase [Actinomycetota bacterium]